MRAPQIGDDRPGRAVCTWLLAVSASFAQYPALPAFQQTAKSPNCKDGKVVLEERRIRAYTYFGADENVIRKTLR